MENLVVPAAWSGRRVFITGHTGFVGSWLALWLKDMRANVSGFALPPPTEPNLHELAGVAHVLAHDTRADIRDAPRLADALDHADPEIVFHLAAQPLVIESYRNPVDTFAVNAMGTANLLEACRSRSALRAIVIVTSDKCYANNDAGRPFSETDPLGGHDPYSASKACAEVITAAYRDSFYGAGGTLVASVRAGNIIGGGDWASDRLVPDCVRAVAAGKPVVLRHPHSTRPWQHVLDAVSGYLVLAQRLLAGQRSVARAWNFGPGRDTAATNLEVATQIMSRLGGTVELAQAVTTPREAKFLSLDSSESQAILGWRSRWGFQHTVAETASWYAAWLACQSMARVTHHQIETYAGA